MSVLRNKHIVVTRAIHQAKPFCELLREHGAIPIVYPCIAIAPPNDPTALDNALENLQDFDWILFTSTNTIHAIIERLAIRNQSIDWTTIKIACVGHKTAISLRQHLKREVDFVPSVYTADDLARQLPEVDGQSIFVPQSAIANNQAREILSQRGADVMLATAYQTTVGQGGEDVPRLLQQKKIDMLTFTSPSTAKYFIKRIHAEPIPQLPTVCIGSSTAKAAHSLGYSHVLVPAEYTLQGMIDVMLAYYRGESRDY